MGTNRNKKSILDLIDCAELELLQSNTDYAKHYLEEEGVNISEESEYAIQYMKKIKFMAKATVNREHDKSLLEKAMDRVKKAITENVHQTNDSLMAYLQSKTPSLHYRKLENWTDDEIRDVLIDIDLLEFLEKFENRID
jgi:hypothetical protein